MTLLAGVPERDWPFDMAKLRDEAERMMRAERARTESYERMNFSTDYGPCVCPTCQRERQSGGDDARFADEWRE